MVHHPQCGFNIARFATAFSCVCIILAMKSTVDDELINTFIFWVCEMT